MKITVNGKKHNLGERLGSTSCKIGFEKVCEIAGISANLVDKVTYKHKDGTSGDLIAGVKCVAVDGSSFSVLLSAEGKTVVGGTENEKE